MASVKKGAKKTVEIEVKTKAKGEEFKNVTKSIDTLNSSLQKVSGSLEKLPESFKTGVDGFKTSVGDFKKIVTDIKGSIKNLSESTSKYFNLIPNTFSSVTKSFFKLRSSAVENVESIKKLFTDLTKTVGVKGQLDLFNQPLTPTVVQDQFEKLLYQADYLSQSLISKYKGAFLELNEQFDKGSISTEKYKKSLMELSNEIAEEAKVKVGELSKAVLENGNVIEQQPEKIDRYTKAYRDAFSKIQEYANNINKIVKEKLDTSKLSEFEEKITSIGKKDDNGIRQLYNDAKKLKDEIIKLSETSAERLSSQINSNKKLMGEKGLSVEQFNEANSRYAADSQNELNKKLEEYSSILSQLETKIQEYYSEKKRLTEEAIALSQKEQASIKETANVISEVAQKAKVDFSKSMDIEKFMFDVKTETETTKMSVSQLGEQINELALAGGKVSLLSKEFEKLKGSLGKENTTFSKAVDKLVKDAEKGKWSVEKFNEELKKLNELKATNIDQISKQFSSLKDKVNSTTDALEKNAKSAEKASGYWKQFFGRVNTYLSYRTINMVMTGLKNLAKSAVDLESSFANIQAITRSTDSTMDKLKNTILKVGEASKYSVTEIADATTTLGQAGLSAEEINNVLETTTQLAAATGSSLSDTVDLMTSALAVWGLNSEEASHLSDVMVTGMNRTKATLQTFRQAVQYAGATMASLNVSFEEFGSVAAAAANAGIRASVVGTGLRAVASELISPTTKMVKGLAKLGLTTEDVNIESNGLVNVLEKLKSAGLDASNAYSLFGRRAAQFILAAQGQLDVVNDLQIAFAESGATLEAYNKQMNTVAAEWTALANTVKEAAYKILNSTNGFIHDMIVGLKNGIRWLLTDTLDEFNSQIKDSDTTLSSLKLYSDLAEKNRKKDYKGDAEKQLKEYNNLVKSLNSIYGMNLEIETSVEGITEKYGGLIAVIEDFRKGVAKSRNEAIEWAKENILETRLTRDFEYNPLENKISTLGTPSYDNSTEFKQLLKDAEKSQEYRAFAKSSYKNYTEELSKAGENINSVYSKLLSDENKRFESLVKKVEEDVKNKKMDKDFAESTLRMQSRFHAIALNVLEASMTAVTKLPGLRNIEKEKAIEDSVKELQEKYNEINKDIADSFTVTNEELEKYKDKADVLFKEDKDRILERLDELSSIMDSINKSKVLDDKDKEGIQNKFIELESKLKNKLVNDSTKVIDQFIKFFEKKNQLSFSPEDSEKIKNLRNLSTDILGITNALDASIKSLDDEIKSDKGAKKTAKELERERAKEFNKRYQNLKLQRQADEYDESISEAKRKGVLSKLDTRDRAGVLSGYYSDTAEDLSKLESLKTALKNKETLETYKKDYGEIFEQVKSGKVTLDEADNKTASLINEMLKLDKSVAEATSEFGNLDDVDLTEINSQVASLEETLKRIEESSDSEFKKLGMGFEASINDMVKSYSMAKLGSTIANDLGDGMSDALYSIVDGSKKAKDAFSDMAKSILEDISKMLMRMAVLKAFEAGMGLLGGSSAPGEAGGAKILAAHNGQMGVKPFANGGFIPKIRAASGTPVRGGIAGKDSVPAMLMPGEYVLKKSAVDALGTNFLNDLNNNAAQTLTKTASNLMDRDTEKKDSEPSVVNVWVVSKEEEAKMGPNDVIATISKDIMTGGTTRRLIQSVVAGRK